MYMSWPAPNVGPYDEQKYTELEFCDWFSLTGAHPGSFRSEKIKASESYLYRQQVESVK